MMWYLISLFGFLSFPIAFTVIVEGPKKSVFPEGSNVTLTCLANFEDTIVWEDLNENTVIFIRKGKNTMKEKFDNFFISDAEGNYSLTIVNAQVSDDGFYSCEEGDERRNANLTVEAGPHLSIFVNNSELVSGKRMNLKENEEASVRCRAVGAKPAVRLQLKFGDNVWVTTSDTITNEGLLFTTEVMVVHRFIRNDTTITCQATGQVSIPPTISVMSMDILHKPICLIELQEGIAECKCNSNPPVSSYSWYINGKLKSKQHPLPIQEYVPANITCSAVNAVGAAPLTSRYVSIQDIQNHKSNKNTVIVVVVVVAVILFAIVPVLLFIIGRKRYKQHCRGNDSPSEADEKFEDAKDTFPQPQNTAESIQLTTNNENAIYENDGTPVDPIEEILPLVPQYEVEAVNNDSGTTPTDQKDDKEDSNEEEDIFKDAKDTFEDNEEGDISLEPNSENAINDNGGTPAEKNEEKSPLDLRGENEDMNKDTGTENDGSPVDLPKVGDSHKVEEAQD